MSEFGKEVLGIHRGEELIRKINYCCMRLEEWGGGKSNEYRQKIIECRAKLCKIRSRRDKYGIKSRFFPDHLEYYRDRCCHAL